MSKLKRYIQLLRIFLIRSGYKRGKYLKKRHYFKSLGEHCYFQIYNFGTEPYLLSFGDNCHIASGVTFVSHDITYMMFNHMDSGFEYSQRVGEISLGNNVFVGSNTTILYDVTIGDNVIIGAGSLVNRSIPSGSVAAGNPCRVIDTFDNYKKKIYGR